MIDIENYVFSPIAIALRGTYDGIDVSSEYTDSPASFPAVTIMEMSNIVYRRISTTKIENGVQLMFEVNVFSNEYVTAKRQAREIMATVDAEFEKMGFTRTTMVPAPNLNDATIYRITARYEGVCVPEYTADGILYRIYST